MSIAPDTLHRTAAIRPASSATAGRQRRRLAAVLRRRLLAVLAALALLTAAVAGVLWRADGYRSAVTDLSSGAIWLANTNAGLLTMINGSTNEAVWRVPVAEPGAPLTTAQLPDGAAVLHHNTGALIRVSTRTLGVTAKATVEPGEGTFAVHEDQLYLFPADPGRPVTRRDPATLAPAAELAIPGGTSGVVDQQGRLWVLEAQRSTLHLVPTDQPAVSRAIPGAEAATLSPTTGGVALIRPDGTVTRATPSDNANLSVQTEQLSISATGWTAVQAAGQLPDRLLLLDPSGARLGSCPTSGDCTLISLAPYATPKDAFGTAQYATGVVFIPVHSTGQVILVDIATGTVRQPVPVIEQPAPFELTATADAVWFNNPTTNEAGKIAGDGTVTKILKYPDDLDASGVRALVANGAGPIGRNEGIGTGGAGGTGPGGGSDEGAVDSEAPNAPDQPQQNDPAATTTTTAPTSSTPTTAADSTSNPPVTATTTAGDSSEDRTPGTSPPAPKPGEPSLPPDSPPTPGPAPETKPTPDPTDSTRAPDPAATPKPSPNQTTDGKPKEEQPTPSDALEAKMALGSTSVEPNTDLQLRDISTGNPDSRLWNFGDGNTAADVAPRHRWTRPGTYTITLTIRKDAEERSTRQSIQVTAELVASFSAPVAARVDEPVSFANTSTGEITRILWNFGDNATSTERSPTHIFQTAGTFTVELRVGNGATEETTRRQIQVDAPTRPKGSFRLSPAPPATLQVPNTVSIGLIVDQGGVLRVAGAPISADDGASSCWLDQTPAAVTIHAARPGTCAFSISQEPSPTVDPATTQTVTVTITGVTNRPPTASPGPASTPSGTSLTLSAGQLGLADPDGDQVTVIERQGGATTLTGTTLTKHPSANALVLSAGTQTGNGTATFAITDGKATIDATLSFTVTAPTPPAQVASVIASFDYLTTETILTWSPVAGASSYSITQTLLFNNSTRTVESVPGSPYRGQFTYPVNAGGVTYTVTAVGPGGSAIPSPPSNVCDASRNGSTGQLPLRCAGQAEPPLPVGPTFTSFTVAAGRVNLTISAPEWPYLFYLAADCRLSTDPDTTNFYINGTQSGVIGGPGGPTSTTATIAVPPDVVAGTRVSCRPVSLAFRTSEILKGSWQEVVAT